MEHAQIYDIDSFLYQMNLVDYSDEDEATEKKKEESKP
jgi:hypothetical protein